MLNMGNPFVNDPFSVVWRAFRELYPDTNCEVVWSNEIEPENPDETAYGFTQFSDDGSVTVCVDVNLRVLDAVEVLAHELSHVAVGIEDGHGEKWSAAFDAIHKKYEEIVSKTIAG